MAGTCRLLALAILLWPVLARAQTFSPGPLAEPHRPYEGLSNCTKCHSGSFTGAAESKIDVGKCKDCHTPIKRNIAARIGLHGKMSSDDKENCQHCHPDHRGLDFKMVKWPGGSQKQFPHEKTGWPLRGAHLKSECADCHAKKNVQDDGVLAYFAKHTKKQTFLGLERACAACHRDSHNNSLGANCTECHDENAWRPAPSFNHNATRYPLLGLHRQVKCDQCHPVGDALRSDPRYRERVFSPLKFKECSECHDDPHNGTLGPYCSECHTEKGWKLKKAPSRVLLEHDKTRFPLKGLHRGVECRYCHPIVAGKQVLRGMKFAQCRDCHPDGHIGQMGANQPDCNSCHNNFGFSPVSFSPARHEKTSYPLVGAHAGVPCMDCHRTTAALKKKVEAVKKSGARIHGVRRSLVSFARFEWPQNAVQRCTTCHKDVHAGQFDDRVAREDCMACHVEQSFHRLRFDHDKDSRFALRGAHKEIDCGLCHTAAKKGAPVRYKPMETTCVSCHPDIHYGQFARYQVDCSACHSEQAWKPLVQFDHNKPPVRFALDGKHAQTACDRCHLNVRLTAQAKTRLYRPLPLQCQGCHEDHHHGQYDAFVPLKVKLTAAKPTVRGGKVSTAVPCAYCHNTSNWQKISFDHDATGFPLTGAHVKTSCDGCHVGGLARKLSHRCEACHKDVHGGQLGVRCERCHNTERWLEARDALEAHRTTNFRLIGGHAAVPCEECHGNVRDRTFRRVPSACEQCHLRDVTRTVGKALDHVAAQLTTNCQQCHTVLRWIGAQYLTHDKCFPITRGAHAGIACLKCHTTLMGATANGMCRTGTANCTQAGCHPTNVTDMTHARDRVEGYAPVNRKCYECHPNGRK